MKIHETKVFSQTVNFTESDSMTIDAHKYSWNHSILDYSEIEN